MLRQPAGTVVAGTALLTLDSIFNSDEFKEQSLGQFHWSKRAQSYFSLETSPSDGKGRDLVRNDLATGKQEVVVPASAFTPSGHSVPLEVEDFEFSTDESKLLLYTNSKRVWRRNIRGDYWVLDLTAHTLERLGGEAAPATLMFAKFSPDGSRVAYVRDNNLYVQELRKLRIIALTQDAAATLINGTSDWANEEELDMLGRTGS